MTQSVLVTVPATTANLGPGFDCLGAALLLNNQFRFTRPGTEAIEPLQIDVTGLEADQVSRNESNLAYQSYLHLFRHLGKSPLPVHIEIDLHVPLGRGLGSSATAIVAGLVGANALLGKPLSQQEVMGLAIAQEGHPDNVVPALLGGCRLSASTGQGWSICDVPWHPDVVPVIAIPNFEISTHEARRILPDVYSRADAIFNVAHLGLLLRGLATGRPDWLKAALQDRIHQPYRQSLIQGYEAIQQAAIAAGAYGLVISGAGPTLLALAHPDQAEAVEAAIAVAWINQGISVQARVLHLNQEGTVVREG